MKAVNLKCEYMINPIGIGIQKPRLFWNCTDGITQTAYQIVATNDRGTEVWNTGKVDSQRMTHIRYEGKALKSRDRIIWKVKLWDETGTEGIWSEEAYFELGLLESADWNAKWITGDYAAKKNMRYPVDCFRKEFQAHVAKTSNPIIKARLYTTACGIYEARINGNRVGDFILAPGITDYRKRIQYQVYDVSSMLEDGKNILTFELADGWYRGSVGAWGMKCYYGTETKLLSQLELTRADGSMEQICSDDSFSWSNDGPIRFADNKDGEEYDARKLASYHGNAKLTNCNVIPAASDNFYITEHEHFKPTVITTPSGNKILNFGQNIAGYVEFKIRAQAGKKIRLRFGEMLDSTGEFTQKNIQCSNKKITTPLQQVEYICKEGENHYKTRFAIFGFQYVLVESEFEWKAEDFTAIAVYSDMETTIAFECSNELLNHFVDCTLWSAKNNSADIPTDCPTRERHGWTGDAQIFFQTAGYLLNYAPFARKFVRDLTDWQDKRGAFPQIAPEGGTDFYMRVMNGSVGWADAGVIIPYQYWKLFGDEQMIRDNYAAMRRYAKFMIRRCGKRGLLAPNIKLSKENQKYLVNKGQAYGEWAEPEEVHKMTWKDCAVPHAEVSTAYTSYVMSLMEEIANKLGKEEDAKLFRRYKEGTKKAYQELMYLPEYSLDTDRQAQLVRPLVFDLLNKKQTEYARQRLIKALEHYDWRIGTGFLSTPLILYVLDDIDLQAAYRLLENEQMPGWLFMPKAGANTIWESWEGTKAQGGVASLNHYSKGACLEWVFRVMCGIQVDGTNHFILAPKPGGHFTYATCEYQSVYGEIRCGWKKVAAGCYQFEIKVPSNTTATFVYPDGTEVDITGNGECIQL